MRIQPPRRAPDSEQRLMVLYCLARLGPCTELQLLRFLFENDLLNYFDMMFALNDLCDRGQAARIRKDEGFLYQATDAGREALNLFGGRVPNSLQKLLLESPVPAGNPEPTANHADGARRLRIELKGRGTGYGHDAADPVSAHPGTGGYAGGALAGQSRKNI